MIAFTGPEPGAIILSRAKDLRPTELPIVSWRTGVPASLP
jgi:hypothetical protein